MLSLAVILPIFFIVAITLASVILDLINPCIYWGASGAVVTVSPGGACSSAGARSETVAQAVSGLTLIQGGISVGAILGILGVLRTRPVFLLISAAILFAESAPLLLDGLFVFSLIPAVFFLWVARKKALSTTSISR
ncbi:MAG: hypothetical protein LYZ69_08540 [Nitrososphaerales archaeon]|nr:hypothetical protein [Nitrososphaerales archaeon]